MVKEVYERTYRLKQQVKNLRIEINQIKKDEEVEGVVDTPFFQDLQSKAKNLRNAQKDEEQAEDRDEG